MAGQAGKDSLGAQAHVAGVHPAPAARPVWPPHLAYGDAVHRELAAAGLVPDVVEAGIRTEELDGPSELVLTLEWLTGHPDLTDPAGMDLLWSHLTGWAVRIGHNVRPLILISAFAAPALLVDVVLHTATEGLDSAWEPDRPLAEWDQARALDVALNTAAERGLIAW